MRCEFLFKSRDFMWYMDYCVGFMFCYINIFLCFVIYFCELFYRFLLSYVEVIVIDFLFGYNI